MKKTKIDEQNKRKLEIVLVKCENITYNKSGGGEPC